MTRGRQSSERGRAPCGSVVFILIVLLSTSHVLAPPGNAQDAPQSEGQTSPPKNYASDWHYGGFVDLGYSLNFNFPENHQFRDRSTTPKVNELDLNMAGVYIRKDATEASR